MTKKTKVLIVNAITLTRLLGTFILPLISRKLNIYVLIISFIILFITDFVDGGLARYWSVQTIGGSLLDPLSDKILAVSCLIVFMENHLYYLAILIFELVILSINVYRTFHEENVKSNYIGKIKTWLLSVTLIFGAINLLKPNLLNDILKFININTDCLYINQEIVFISFIITGIFEILTIISYILESIKSKKKKKYKHKFKPFKKILIRLFDTDSYESDRQVPLIKIISKNN